MRPERHSKYTYGSKEQKVRRLAPVTFTFVLGGKAAVSMQGAKSIERVKHLFENEQCVFIVHDSLSFLVSF